MIEIKTPRTDIGLLLRLISDKNCSVSEMTLIDKIKSALKHWQIIYFVFGLCLLTFFYGVAVGEYKISPYSVFREAKQAARELWHWVELKMPKPLEDHPHIINFSGFNTSTTNYDSGRTYQGYTFITMYTYDQFGMYLIDMDGMVMHKWKIPEAVFKRVRKKDWDMEKGHYMIQGAHLFENGDVILNVEYHGLAKIDRDSNLIWFLNEPTHHSVFVDDEGTIWVPSRHWVRDPQKALPRMNVPYFDDLILRVSGDGEILDRISVSKAVYSGKYHGILLSGDEHPQTKTLDPTHLNSVKLIGKKFAEVNEFANEDDILVSFRTTDSIAIIDKKDKKVKWALSGPFLRQHDPVPSPDGTIYIFDNRTDIAMHNEARYLTEPQSFGYSRVIQIEPKSQKIVWSYNGSVERPFYTSTNGKQQVLENGNVLIVETEGGRVFEVSKKGNDIVWEFQNILKVDNRTDLLGRVTQATRLEKDKVKFLIN